jgi:hypothetical protein
LPRQLDWQALCSTYSCGNSCAHILAEICGRASGAPVAAHGTAGVAPFLQAASRLADVGLALALDSAIN